MARNNGDDDDLEKDALLAQLQAEAEKVQAAFAAAMTAEGLDPAKTYTFTDADESAVEVTP